MTLTERLGIDLPILQAPMAGAQGCELAIAVSRAGGLGDASPLWAGQNASRCREVSAVEVVRELARGQPR